MVCRDRQTAFLLGLKAGVSCLYEDESGVGVKFVLDRPAAEDALEGSIKVNFDVHSWIIGILAGSGAVLIVERTQIQFIYDCADNPRIMVCRDEFIEREGEQQSLILVIGFEADIPNHDNTVEDSFQDFFPL